MSFQYTRECIDNIRLTLSAERLSTYLARTDGNLEAAIRLHARNTALSEALYTPLQGLEIALRNSFHNQLEEVFGLEWYENTNCPLAVQSLSKIDEAKENLARNRKIITPGRIIAELNFGFWTGLLINKYETTLWRPCLRKAYKRYGPSRLRRKQVYFDLHRIQRLRNRIAHHEPILFRDLETEHKIILKNIKLLCPHTAEWVAYHSSFENTRSRND